MYKWRSRIIILIIMVLFLNSCGYNTMQRYEEAVFKSWGDLESQLQRRADLIPNLVAVVKGYAAHEKETLEAVRGLGLSDGMLEGLLSGNAGRLMGL